LTVPATSGKVAASSLLEGDCKLPETPEPIYANVLQITTGPFDMVFDFGFKSPERTRSGSADFDVVARVAMSLGHAKSMLPLLARQIAEYEEKVGPITAPGFEEFSSE
jgi:hypothetical protein